MNFYFCETCGKRVTEKDLKLGAAHDKNLAHVFCIDCVASGKKPADDDAKPVLAATPAPAAASESGGRSAAVRPPSGMRIAVPKAQRPPTDSKMPAVRAKPSVSLQRPSQTPLIIGAVSAGIVILAIAFALSGSNKEPDHQRMASTPTNEPKSGEASRGSPVQQRAPEPSQPPPPAPVALAPRSFPSGLLAEDHKEPSPKELYDQAVKEGRIKPADATAAAAPATPPPSPAAPAPIAPPIDTKGANLLAIVTPAADDSTWKPLFNGKDLTGWSAAKGTWIFENGMAVCTFSGDGGARLDGAASYGDFELTAQLMTASRTYMDIRTHETRSCDFQIKEGGTWHAFRLVTIGTTTQATLDGQPVTAHGDCGASGDIRIYVDKGCTLKIKDMKLRPLTAGDLAK